MQLNTIVTKNCLLASGFALIPPQGSARLNHGVDDLFRELNQWCPDLEMRFPEDQTQESAAATAAKAELTGLHFKDKSRLGQGRGIPQQVTRC